MRGLTSAAKFHEENTNLPYIPFKIKENDEKKFRQVRVLAKADPELDPETGEPIPGVPFIVSLFMHNKFKVLPSTRCVSQDSQKAPGDCPLCRVDAPRSLKTFIPLRERGDENPTRVKVAEYGRDGIQEVVSAVEEVEDGDITSIDFKIKRVGKGKDTTYKWYPVPSTERPLNAEELALEVPDIEALIPVKDESELEKLAVQYERAVNAQKVDDDKPAAEEEEIPF